MSPPRRCARSKSTPRRAARVRSNRDGIGRAASSRTIWFPATMRPWANFAWPGTRPSLPRLLTEVDLRLEIGARVGAGQCLFQFDAALAHKIVERAVETQHAAFRAGSDRLFHADHIAFLDEFRDVRSIHHDLGSGNPSSGLREYQALRQDGAKILREVQKNLVVLIARKHVDDAVQSLGAIVRMQGRDAEVRRP